MKNDLNSALALFQALYSAQKGDVYTIIERFILVGVKSKGLMSFTGEEIVKLLEDTFNVVLPYSVIQRCISTRQEVFRYTHGKYVVNNPMDEEVDNIIAEMDEKEKYKEDIITELVSFVEKRGDKKLTENEKITLGQLFFDFVVDKEHLENDDYRLCVTQFIIEKEKDERFQRFLNSMWEGMVIYKGIRYSDAPDDTSWKSNTDFFLDQEYLFSACGMNGPFYEKCFFEFYNLVREINKASIKMGGRDRIRLFYFPETKEDIETYFTQAIRIRRMQERYCYPQTAMDSILNSCREDVDIERYKTNFYSKLKGLHIVEFPDEIDLSRNQDFLFENDDFEMKKNEHFNIDQHSEVNYYVKIADYINILRQGKRCQPLEKCKCIFLSEGNLSNALSRFIRDYYTDRKPIVIAHMGKFTELMWFKLRKGVVGANSSVTISVVNKAKTIVSSLLYDNLKKQYDAVLAMDEDESKKKDFYADLRMKRYSPDDINSETIADDIAFIDNSDYLEKYTKSQEILREKAAKVKDLEIALEQERAEKTQLIEKMNAFDEYIKKENERKVKNAFVGARKKIFRCRLVLKNYVWIVNVLIVMLFLVPSVYCMEIKFVNIATVVGTFLAVEVLVNGLFAKKRNKVRKTFQKKYRKIIQIEMGNQGLELQ